VSIGGTMKRMYLLLLLILSAVSSGLTQQNVEYEYTIPEKLDDGWRVSSPGEEGMDINRITRLTRQLIAGKYEGIHSILIVKNGAIVYEAYLAGYDQNSLQTIYSITKSVTSALIGIAIDKGFISGVGATLVSLLPEYKNAIKDERLENIRLEHILTLTSGLEWDERTSSCCDPKNSECRQVSSDDWIRFVLGLPQKDEPGTQYVYNTGSVHLLSAVIKSQTGLGANEFAERHLFGPLGIRGYEWNTDPQGYQCTGGTHGGLRLRTRDLAKFGYLFLHEGKWQDKQVISPEWVHASTTRHTAAFQDIGIGYLWWTGSFTIRNRKLDFFYGAGYGGQSLHVVPELDLMIVLTCWGRAEDADILGPTLMIYNAALED